MGENDNRGSRYLVLWSGGVDSTVILDQLACASDGVPVVAVSVGAHPCLDPDVMASQRSSRWAYLAWSKDHGLEFRSETVEVKGSFRWGLDANHGPRYNAPTAQAVMWLYALAQVVGDGDEVSLGYMRGDAFWHYRDRFEAAFDAMCRLKGVEARLCYPLEWSVKIDVLRYLRERRIPQRCWHSCEHVVAKGRPCGQCAKCLEIKAVRAQLADERRAKRVR